MDQEHSIPNKDEGPEDVDATETRFLLGQVGRKAIIGLRNDE